MEFLKTKALVGLRRCDNAQAEGQSLKTMNRSILLVCLAFYLGHLSSKSVKLVCPASP